MAIASFNDLPNPDAEQMRLISQRSIFLDIWQKQFVKAGFYPDWDSLPTIDTRTGSIWHQVPIISATATYAFTDRFQAWIYGVKDGVRYYRTVEVAGRERESGVSAEILLRALNAVQRLGPSSCTPVEDGGILPRPEDQVSIEGQP